MSHNPYHFPSWGSSNISGYGDSSDSVELSSGGSNIDWSQAIAGGFGLAGNYAGMANQKLGINANVNQYYDPNMMPTYNGGQLASQLSTARARGASGGEILSGAGQGAAAGSAFGLPGAAIGAVVGGLGSAIVGGVRKRSQERELTRARKKLGAMQSTYNTNEAGYRARQNQMEDYYQGMNPDARLYNLYRNQY